MAAERRTRNGIIAVAPTGEAVGAAWLGFIDSDSFGAPTTRIEVSR